MKILQQDLPDSVHVLAVQTTRPPPARAARRRRCRAPTGDRTPGRRKAGNYSILCAGLPSKRNDAVPVRTKCCDYAQDIGAAVIMCLH